MIRKRVGEEFWLIAQQDHARVAGTIARAFGNRQFARPARAEVVYAAIDAHDDGWALHDAAPTLDAAGLPTDVFDTPRAVAHAAWLASAERAAAYGPYAGLLVALHQLSLSARAAAAAQSDKPDDEQRRRQFDLNKVQHALIEHAEALRATLGRVIDRPLRLGLAEGWTDPAEEQLKFDLRLLQACDILSLAACCDALPPGLVPQPQPRPGAAQIMLGLSFTPGGLGVRPWPFEPAAVRVAVPYRAVPAALAGERVRFLRAFNDAATRMFGVELRPT